MAKGVYDRVKDEPKDEAPESGVDIVGRTVWKIECHNGVCLGLPPLARADKAIFHKDAPFSKPPHRQYANKMVKTQTGIYIEMEGSPYDYHVPDANTYITVLAKPQEG